MSMCHCTVGEDMTAQTRDVTSGKRRHRDIHHAEACLAETNVKSQAHRHSHRSHDEAPSPQESLKKVAMRREKAQSISRCYPNASGLWLVIQPVLLEIKLLSQCASQVQCLRRCSHCFATVHGPIKQRPSTLDRERRHGNQPKSHIIDNAKQGIAKSRHVALHQLNQGLEFMPSHFVCGLFIAAKNIQPIKSKPWVHVLRGKLFVVFKKQKTKTHLK